MLKNIKTLIIDMDECIYPKSLGLGKQFIRRVEDYVRNILKYDDEETAKLLSIWKEDDEKGLAFLQSKGVAPEKAMEYICAIDVSTIEYNPELRKQLKLISLNKIIYTNSTHSHINDVLSGRMKIKDLFDDFYTTKETGWVFKHNPKSFEKLLKDYSLDPALTAIIEDNPKYLKSAKQNGITTILVQEHDNGENYPYIDYKVRDIKQALDLFIYCNKTKVYKK